MMGHTFADAHVMYIIPFPKALGFIIFQLSCISASNSFANSLSPAEHKDIIESVQHYNSPHF